jgi:hypothetical protein
MSYFDNPLFDDRLQRDGGFSWCDAPLDTNRDAPLEYIEQLDTEDFEAERRASA